MPDIFDQLDAADSGGDIFDQIESAPVVRPKRTPEEPPGLMSDERLGKAVDYLQMVNPLNIPAAARQAYGGAKELITGEGPEENPRVAGFRNLERGVGGVVGPPLIAAGMAIDAVPTAVGLAAGAGAQYLTRKALAKTSLSPEVSDVLSDVGGLVAGGAAAHSVMPERPYVPAPEYPNPRGVTEESLYARKTPEGQTYYDLPAIGEETVREVYKRQPRQPRQPQPPQVQPKAAETPLPRMESLGPATGVLPTTNPTRLLYPGLEPGENFRRTASGLAETYPAPEYAAQQPETPQEAPGQNPPSLSMGKAPETQPEPPSKRSESLVNNTAPVETGYPGAKGKVATAIASLEAQFRQLDPAAAAEIRKSSIEASDDPTVYRDTLAMMVRSAELKAGKMRGVETIKAKGPSAYETPRAPAPEPLPTLQRPEAPTPAGGARALLELGKVQEANQAEAEQLRAELAQVQRQRSGADRRIASAELQAGQVERRLADRRAQAIAPSNEAAKPEVPLQPSGIQPGEVGKMPTAEIHADPRRFQFKLDVNEKGVSRKLADVEKYDPHKAGVISVWTDPADGKTYVVNGHHRLELAVRAEQPTVNVMRIKADTAAQARSVGALQNISEGMGTPMDAAKFMRDTGMGIKELAAEGVPSTSAVARKGLALSRLDQKLFDRVALGGLSENRGAAIGEATADPTQQWAIADLIDKAEAKGRRVSDDTVSELARLATRSGSVTTTQDTLFGTEEVAQSTALDKAELSAHIRSQLAKEKKLFGYASSEARAAELGKAGNVLNVEENAKIAERANQAKDVYDRLSSYTGPIDDILEHGARRIASGEDANAVRKQAYESVRHELERNLGAPAESSSVSGSEQAAQGSLPGEWGATNRVVGKDAYDQASKNLKDFFGGNTLRSGLDPTVLADIAKVGAYHIEAGLREFGAWSQRMVQDYGERIRPHLEDAWNAALELGKRGGIGADRAAFTTTEVSHQVSKVSELLAQLSDPAQTILKRGEETFERGTVPKRDQAAFYGSDRPQYEATYSKRISVEDTDKARNALRDAHDATANWLREMQNMGDEQATLIGRAAVQYLNEASELFKQTGTIAGRVLQARQRLSLRQAGLPTLEEKPATNNPISAAPGKFIPAGTPATLVDQARVLVDTATEQLRGIKTFRQREPITTGLINAIKGKRWGDAARYAVEQLRMNLFSVGSWTLDAIGNASELTAQGAGGIGHDLVYVARSGRPTFPSLTGIVQAIKNRIANRGLPMDAEIERAFGKTAGGENIPLFPSSEAKQPGLMRAAAKVAKVGERGAFTYGKTPASKALDLVQGTPLYLKGAMDTAARRIAATGVLYRDAIKAADSQRLAGPRRQAYIDQYLANAPKASIEAAIREGNKAGFNRPLSSFEENVSRSMAYRLLGDAFARWPFQFTRWAGEMLGYNPELLGRVKAKTATPEDLGAYFTKTASGWGGMLLLNKFYDRVDFNSMEYVTPTNDRVRLSGREPVATAFWLLSLIKGDLPKAAAGLKYVSVPGGRIVQEGGPGGGLLGSFLQAVGQAVSNPQNDPRALKRELEQTMNRAIPGQAVLGFVKSITDPTMREGLGSNIPGVSALYPARTNPTTGGPLRPMMRVPYTSTPLPTLTGTPVPGTVRLIDPVEKLLNRYGMVVYRGPRQPIAGFPASDVEPVLRRQWEREFGQQRNALMAPWAEAFQKGELDGIPEDRIRKRLQDIDARAARIATATVNADAGTGNVRLPRKPTNRELARPSIYQQ